MGENEEETTVIYISGRITGVSNFREKFRAAQVILYANIKRAYVINPVIVGDRLEKEIGRRPTWAEYMREDIRALVVCDAVYMLRGWWRSKGARLEWVIAKACGLKIMYE